MTAQTILKIEKNLAEVKKLVNELIKAIKYSLPKEIF